MRVGEENWRPITESAAVSFGKHDPPKPGPAWRNFAPIRLSMPIALATSWTSQPTHSQRFAISFMKEIFVARKAFAAYLISSEPSKEVITNGVSIKYRGR